MIQETCLFCEDKDVPYKIRVYLISPRMSKLGYERRICRKCKNLIRYGREYEPHRSKKKDNTKIYEEKEG